MTFSEFSTIQCRRPCRSNLIINITMKLHIYYIILSHNTTVASSTVISSGFPPERNPEKHVIKYKNNVSENL